METLLPGLRSAVNLHPMVVHFPVAFWVAASVVWALALLRKKQVLWHAGLWLHTAGAATAIVAVAAGYLGTSLMGHDAPGHSYVHVHRDIMLGATALSVLITGVGWWRVKSRSEWREILVPLTIIQVIVMTLGADRGAFLVYQQGVGVEIHSTTSSQPHNSESMDKHR